MVVTDVDKLQRQIMDLQPQLVSFDVFDTLLWRPFRRPTDLFLHLPSALSHLGVSHGLDPRALANRRVSAELRSRRRGGTPEVTLAEIISELRREWDSVNPESLVAAELFLEKSHLQPHADALAVIVGLHTKGIPYALCSDMYLPSEWILQTVREAAGRLGLVLPKPRAVLVSGEKRSGKSDQLFALLARETGFAASRIVHVGDNPQADVASAHRHGIQALHLPRTCAVAEEILDAEEKWMPEVMRGARDFGLSASRKQILAEMCSEGSSLADARAYGAFVFGPVFAAFAAWVVLECRRLGIRHLHTAMREGVFLSRLLKGASELLDYSLDISCLWASRFALRSAELAEATPQALIDFLLNVRGVDLRADLLRQLGFLDERSEADWTSAQMDGAALVDKLTWIRGLLDANPAVLDAVRHRGAQRREGLSVHLRRHGLQEVTTVHLVDVGWGGSIQAGLAASLRRGGWAGRVCGIYLGTNHLINRLNSAHCPWSSYLYQAGLPLESARIVQRTPELIEQACMSPHGSLYEFTPAGDPVLFVNNLPPRQLADVAAMQDGIMDFARLWWPRFVLSGGAGAPPDEAAAFDDRVRAVVSRSIMEPRAEEVDIFREWRHDSNNGSSDLRPLLGTEEAALLVREGKVKHPWQLDWQQSYWPQGLFVALRRPWSGKLSGRTRFLVRMGNCSARMFGRFDPWPKLLNAWLRLRLRLRHVLLSRP